MKNIGLQSWNLWTGVFLLALQGSLSYAQVPSSARSERADTQDRLQVSDQIAARLALYKIAQELEVEGDMLGALALYRHSARIGSRRAALRLGEIYAEGQTVPKDLPQSKFWYARARELGETKSEQEDRLMERQQAQERAERAKRMSELVRDAEARAADARMKAKKAADDARRAREEQAKSRKE
jgi:TPR repeat protein